MEENEEESNEEEKEISQQELTAQFQMFEQQIRMIQEQQQAVEQAIVELSTLNLELDELIGKKDNEIMAPIGRGIYARAKLVSEDFLVDIGNKNFVKKSIPETKEIIGEQVKKLEKAREELNGEMEKINTELTNVFMAGQGMNAEEGHSHAHHHGHACSCGGECTCDEEGECECEEECECIDDNYTDGEDEKGNPKGNIHL